MDFVTVRDLRIKTGEVWEKLEREKELIVTSNGRPIALMSGISAKTLESTLAAVRRARGEVAIRSLRKASQEKGFDQLKPKDIDKEVQKTRRKPR